MEYYTVEFHVEGVDAELASELLAEFVRIAESKAIIDFSGAVYETPSDEEQIETIKKQAEMIDDDGDEDNA